MGELFFLTPTPDPRRLGGTLRRRDERGVASSWPGAAGEVAELLEGTNASPQNILVHAPSEVALSGAEEALLHAGVPGSGAHVVRVLAPVAATQVPVSDV